MKQLDIEQEVLRKEIIERLKDDLQPIYGKLLKFVGTEYGDIAPDQLFELEEAEEALGQVVASWLINGMEQEEDDEDE